MAGEPQVTAPGTCVVPALTIVLLSSGNPPLPGTLTRRTACRESLEAESGTCPAAEGRAAVRESGLTGAGEESSGRCR
jgi:hypothetical protein